jgi:hypothetical protein
MQLFLDYNRMAYDRGFRLPDPDDKHGGQDLIMPAPRELILGQMFRN